MMQSENKMDEHKNMTIKEAVETASFMLKQNQREDAFLHARSLLCHVLDCDKSLLYMYPEKIIPHNSLEKFMELVQLRVQGMPLQYITGKQEFMSLCFKVTPGILIPRADTEILVEEALKYLEALYVRKSCQSVLMDVLDVLDVGTGTGCIALSIWYYMDMQPVRITAVDISEEAISIAGQNAEMIYRTFNENKKRSMDRRIEEDIVKVIEENSKKNIEDHSEKNIEGNTDDRFSGKVAFYKSDLFNSLPNDKVFDLIVSNPPYITMDEMETLDRDVKDFEPHHALYGGVDGLDYYRRIIAEGIRYLKPEGGFMFECGFRQAQALKELLEQNLFHVSVVKDLSGIERVVIGERTRV